MYLLRDGGVEREDLAERLDELESGVGETQVRSGQNRKHARLVVATDLGANFTKLRPKIRPKNRFHDFF
jgi:hypothetical protein